MERFEGKIAIVTGASSGIGAAIAKSLAESGMIVVGFARRTERIEELSKKIKGKLLAVKVDVTKEEDILRGFKSVTDNLGPVHVLVNNAGVGSETEIIDGETEKWRVVLDTNFLGVAIASREVIKIMRANNIDGHIININSTLGHRVVNAPGLNVYPASKFALRALTETLKLELVRLGSKIKVTSLSPGLVDTDIFKTQGTTIDLLQTVAGIEVPLECEDVANGVKYVISTPPHVQVTELIIEPIGQVV